MKSQTVFYTAAVFLSAYLLFAVQPMIGKVLLPSLGGAPAIWNTTMLFFQLLLLGGYLYAHILTKIPSLRMQFITHLGLMAAAGITLPMTTISPSPDDINSPILWQLKIMAGMMAAPFLILSATAPMLQRWFSFTKHPSAGNPYFLYAASNTGSIIALVLYPSLVEFFIPLNQQALFWSFGFWGLIVLITIICLSSLKNVIKIEEFVNTDESKITLKQIALWLVLAFIPSSLMLGLTSHITVNIGSLPLFWVIPLTLYILSFVLAFAKRQIIPLTVTRALFAILFPFVFCILNIIPDTGWGIASIHCVLLFITCLMCHQELVRVKPSVKHLTFFFLIMSVGGALGGIFNAIIAPNIFVQPYEYMIVGVLSLLFWGINEPFFAKIKTFCTIKNIINLILVLLISAIFFAANFINNAPPEFLTAKIIMSILSCILIVNLMDKRPLFIIACLAMVIANPNIKYNFNQNIVDLSRNYFGTLSVSDKKDVRSMSHGDTIHGEQALDPKLANIPLTYFNKKTANGEAITLIKDMIPNANIAILGLGTGSAACLLDKNNNIDFYEIDPAVVSIVRDRNLFTYLSGCNVPYEIIMGDARINLQKNTDKKYDMVFVDVFSGDNIPMHLITKQAAEIYLQKIKENGVVLFHISNRFFNLGKELGYISRDLNTQALYRITTDGKVDNTQLLYSPVYSVTFSNNKKYISELEKLGWKKIKVDNDNKRAWTDDFATPLRSIILGKHNHPFNTVLSGD